MGVPPNHPFDFWIFHYKPSILESLIYGNPHIYIHTVQQPLCLEGRLHRCEKHNFVHDDLWFPHSFSDFQVILPIFTSGARTARARTRSATTTAAAGATGDGRCPGWFLDGAFSKKCGKMMGLYGFWPSDFRICSPISPVSWKIGRWEGKVFFWVTDLEHDFMRYERPMGLNLTTRWELWANFHVAPIESRDGKMGTLSPALARATLGPLTFFGDIDDRWPSIRYEHHSVTQFLYINLDLPVGMVAMGRFFCETSNGHIFALPESIYFF